jgi:outer membrane protein
MMNDKATSARAEPVNPPRSSGRWWVLVASLACSLASSPAQADDNIIKFGVSAYTTNSKTSGVVGPGLPAGADAETGNATTMFLEYERMISANLGVELAIGYPPKIKAKGAGTVAFLGDDILSAKSVSPTLFIDYHFGAEGDSLRPFVALGVNYTRFVGIESRLAPDVQLSDSVGPAAKVGLEYALSKEWSVLASVSAVKVKSDLVATGATVLRTTIDFRPVIYSIGAAYRF